MKKLIWLVLVASACAQTHTFPATDTTNVFTGPNSFQNSTALQTFNQCTDSSNTNAYACTVAGTMTALPNALILKVSHTNTGAASINPNSVGVVPIKKWVSGALVDVEASDLAIGQNLLLYDGANYDLSGLDGGGRGIAGNQYQGVYLASDNTPAADPNVTSNTTSWTSTHSAGIFAPVVTATGPNHAITIPDGGTEASNTLTMQGGVLYNNTSPVAGGGFAGTLGQPTYGTGSSVSSVNTELAADQFSGADICLKIADAVTHLPSTGGVIVLSAQNYPACASAYSTSRNNINIRGAGMGNFSTGICATTVNFPAASSGITLTGQSSSVEGFCIKSSAVVLGTGDGLTFGGGSPKCNRVVVEGFSRDGVVLNDGTDFWDLTTCQSDSNKRDGFRFTAGCTDENAGTARNPSSTRNGGVGYNILCGVSNVWIIPHASSNTGGDYVLNTNYNTFISPYAEIGTGSSFILGSITGYNRVFFYAFGQPTSIIDNGVPGTNEIHYDAFGGTDGQYPTQDTLSISGPPQNSPVSFYSWIADGGSYGAQELVLRDRLNTLNIYSYVPSVGHTFLRPVFLGLDNSIAGSLSLSNGSVLAHTTLGTQATSTWTFKFPTTAGTVGQILETDGSGNTSWTSGAGGGITNSAPNNVFPLSDGTNIVTSHLDDGLTSASTITSSEPINAPSISMGSSLPVSCGAANGIWCTKGGSTAGSPTAGEAYIRYDTVSNIWKKSENGGAEAPLGGGTVTNFTAGNLAPLFTTSVGTASTTPALTFNQSTFAAHKWYGNNTGSTAAPGAQSPACADISDASAFCNGTSAASLSVGALANGMTATTQSLSDNTTKVATDAFVLANVAIAAGTGFNGGAGASYQDAAAISAPSNPGSGCRLYIDSGTGNLSGKKSSGASCMPAAGAASWSTITGGDNTSQAFGVRSGSSFLINYNTASLAAALTGTLFQFGNADGTASRMEGDSFANSTFYTGARSDGTAASPSSLIANDSIVGLNAWGHNGSSVVGPQAAIAEYASQNWTVSHLGTYIRMFTTPNNSTTITEAATIENDGGITVPSTVTGGSKGAGTINATNLYVGGVAVSAPVPLTYYSPLLTGASTITFAGSADVIRGTQFFLPAAVTFSNIYMPVNTTDASNPVYGAAIINVGAANGGFGTSGTAICHNSSGVQLGTNGLMTAFPCTEGSVTLQPGNYAILSTSHSTVGKYQGSAAVSTFWASAAVAGCTASNGIISFSSPCTVSFAASSGGVMADFYLH